MQRSARPGSPWHIVMAHRLARDIARDRLALERFGRLVEGLRRHCRGLIIQLSTGGRSGAGRERGGMISLKPDMCSLSTGSCNFVTRIYENSPDLVDWLAAEMKAHGKPEIEAFDLSMIFKAVEMGTAGAIQGPLHVQFVMGVKNAMPVGDARVLHQDLEAPGARGDVDGGRHRSRPDHAEPLVPGARRPLPNGAGGKCQARQEHAGTVQRGVGQAHRRCGW